MSNENVKSLLLIEDDPDDQDLFELALKEVSPSIVVMKAFDGQNALEQLNAPSCTRPDLIVLDINMPRMNGKEFLVAIKKHDQFQHIPIVLYSTTSEAMYVNEIIKLGVKSFFRKPDTFDALCEEINSALKAL